MRLPIIGVNFAWADMPVSKTEEEDSRFASLMGEGKSLDDMHAEDTFKTGLGWDFDAVWQWDELTQRPLLRGCTEETGKKPALRRMKTGIIKSLRSRIWRRSPSSRRKITS